MAPNGGHCRLLGLFGQDVLVVSAAAFDPDEREDLVAGRPVHHAADDQRRLAMAWVGTHD